MSSMRPKNVQRLYFIKFHSAFLVVVVVASSSQTKILGKVRRTIPYFALTEFLSLG